MSIKKYREEIPLSVTNDHSRGVGGEWCEVDISMDVEKQASKGICTICESSFYKELSLGMYIDVLYYVEPSKNTRCLECQACQKFQNRKKYIKKTKSLKQQRIKELFDKIDIKNDEEVLAVEFDSFYKDQGEAIKKPESKAPEKKSFFSNIITRVIQKIW